jgi:UDP:flavonoid glycosyltransferase YjiC (YdhE family)
MALAKKKLACFVSPHGFGHAARTVAIMTALQDRDPAIDFDVFTTVPVWFFEQSGCRNVSFHAEPVDIGFVQRTAFAQDIAETLRRLAAFVPFAPALVARLAAAVRAARCRAVLCDIAPLGIAVAHAAGLPSVLVENFTWARLYPAYGATDSRLADHGRYFGTLDRTATCHIQTEPICHREPADLIAGPVSRKVRMPAAAVRAQLGVPPAAKLVLITMGGIAERPPFLGHLAARPDVRFLVAGVGQALRAEANVIWLPQDSPLRHPDLVNAVDAVVGKAGYGTIAEVYRAGVPFGYVTRDNYPETPGLVAFIRREMPALHLDGEDLHSGRWVDRLNELLSLPRAIRVEPNGADQIAEFLLRQHEGRI